MRKRGVAWRSALTALSGLLGWLLQYVFEWIRDAFRDAWAEDMLAEHPAVTATIEAAVRWLAENPMYLTLGLPLAYLAWSLRRTPSVVEAAAPDATELAVIDDLERLAAQAEKASITALTIDDTKPAWDAGNAFRDAVEAAQSRLRADTVALLRACAQAMLEAPYRAEQTERAMDMRDTDAGLAKLRRRWRLRWELTTARHAVVEHFRQLRANAGPPRSPKVRFWQVPRLEIHAIAAGRTVFLDVTNRGGTAAVTAWGMTFGRFSDYCPYPMHWQDAEPFTSYNGPPSRRLTRHYGNRLVLATTTANRPPINSADDRNEALDLPGADGTGAMRRELWRVQRPEDVLTDPIEYSYWRSPEVLVEVRITTDPAAPSGVLYRAYRISATSDSEPTLTVAEVPRLSSADW
jgi:hypothetical protein